MASHYDFLLVTTKPGRKRFVQMDDPNIVVVRCAIFIAVYRMYVCISIHGVPAYCFRAKCWFILVL